MSLIFEALKKGPGVTPLALAGHASLAVPPSGPASVLPIVSYGAPPQALLPWRGLVLALFTGMALAACGAWLYQAGKSELPRLSSREETARTASLDQPVVRLAALEPARLPPVLAESLPTPFQPSAPVLVAPTLASAPAPAPAPAKVTVAVAIKPAPMMAAMAVAMPAPARAVTAPALDLAAVVPVLAVAVSAPALDPAAKSIAPVSVAETKPVPPPPLNTQVQLSSEVTPFDTREAFQAFVQLLQMGKLLEAQIAADKFTAALGNGHVMSLRAQGYLAFKKNDLGKAKSQYLQLHHLLPEDREAGLNLSLIDWRQGDHDSAARRVARLLEKFPNDAELQALAVNVRNP